MAGANGTKKKGFISRLIERLDKKMEEKANAKPCCGSKDKKGDRPCCSR
jgi:hypothetical protein